VQFLEQSGQGEDKQRHLSRVARAQDSAKPWPRRRSNMPEAKIACAEARFSLGNPPEIMD
jgi:hypothetical protein